MIISGSFQCSSKSLRKNHCLQNFRKLHFHDCLILPYNEQQNLIEKSPQNVMNSKFTIGFHVIIVLRLTRPESFTVLRLPEPPSSTSSSTTCTRSTPFTRSQFHILLLVPDCFQKARPFYEKTVYLTLTFAI